MIEPVDHEETLQGSDRVSSTNEPVTSVTGHCETCLYAHIVPPTPGMDLTARTYECRRMPPHPNVLAVPTAMGVNIQTLSVFPTTKATNWCGEWKRTNHHDTLTRPV